DALGAQGVEVGLVGTEQFEVLQAGTAGQEVVGQVEDMVGLEVREVAFEQVQVPVEGVGQAQLPYQQLKGTEAAAAQALSLVAHLVVDSGVTEHGAALFLPLPLTQAALQAALAIAETAAYLGVHLKYLHVQRKGS